METLEKLFQQLPGERFTSTMGDFHNAETHGTERWLEHLKGRPRANWRARRTRNQDIEIIDPLHPEGNWETVFLHANGPGWNLETAERK